MLDHGRWENSGPAVREVTETISPATVSMINVRHGLPVVVSVLQDGQGARHRAGVDVATQMLSVQVQHADSVAAHLLG